MALLTKEEAHSLLKKALGYSRADECSAGISGSEGGNIRYARNAVSTSGFVDQTSMNITSAYGKRQGLVTLNEFDEARIEKAVRRSEELARFAPENPEYMPLLSPQTYGPEAKTFFSDTAGVTAKQRTDLVAQSLQVAKDNNLVAAGFLQHSAGFGAAMNSHGLATFNSYTNVNFSVTMRTTDGTGSGYMAKDYNDIGNLDVLAASKTAAWKAVHSAGAKAIEPGKYTVILEPAAGIVLLENLWGSLDARSADEGRSFLSKTGGKTRLGEKLVDERVNIYSDPSNADLPTANYDLEGLPQQRTSWIEKGVVKNLVYSRFWAKKQGVQPMPSPNGLIMAGGTASLEDLIKSTEKGILVTRLWYIRSVDPQTLLFTGLTRDGTFYIEDGEIRFPVRNFRFNESPVIMLNNLETLGKTERAVSGEGGGSALVPPMKIRDFTFTSLSDAI